MECFRCKYKGMTMQDIVKKDKGYFEWMLNQDWLKSSSQRKIEKYLSQKEY